MIRALDRKLLRDSWRLKTQLLSIALVVAYLVTRNSVRGPWFWQLDAVAAVALPNVAGEYTRAQLPPQSTEHLRLPRAQLLDVFTSISNWMSLQQPPVATCSELVHSSMDRKLAILMVESATKHQISISRKVLRTLPDGRVTA